MNPKALWLLAFFVALILRDGALLWWLATLHVTLPVGLLLFAWLTELALGGALILAAGGQETF